MKKKLIDLFLNKQFAALFSLTLFFSLTAKAQYNSQLIFTPGTTTFTVPCGVTTIHLQVWGGGGGAGKSNTATGGSGGGGGGFTSGAMTVVPGTVYSVVVGAGGTGGSGGSGNGTTGGTSNFGGGLYIATGGSGGNANGGTAGVGGTASGGTAYSGTAGVVGTSSFGGGGGENGQGAGAAQNNVQIDTDGKIGGTGGGGSGGYDATSSAQAGGDGGPGRIIISFNGPDAGTNVNLNCGISSTTLAANSPAGGATGTWSVVSGTATITSPTSPTSTVTGLVAGACAQLKWTWTGGGAGCTSLNSTIFICRDGTALCNDNPCSALSLGTPSATSCTPVTYSNSGATPAYNSLEPGCGSYLDKDLWFSVVVPASGDLIFDAADVAGAPNIHPQIALYKGTPCSGLTHMGCFATTTTTNTVSYSGVPGETIYVRLWDETEQVGNFTFCAYTTSFAGEGTILPGFNTFTCGSAGTGIFKDPGGNSNYLNNQSSSYTICASDNTQYVQVDFTSFNLGTGDQLVVINGGSPGDPVIGIYTGSTSPGTVISSDLGGCLTFAFNVNNTGTGTGWAANVSCSITSGSNVNSTYCKSSNCNGGCGTWMCQDGGYPLTNAVTGGVDELSGNTGGCLGASGETSTNWLYFQPQTSGTLEISIDGPNGQSYDFAVYGPTTDGSLPCPLGTGKGPIRCSMANTANPTGIGNGADDFFEESTGDGWVAGMNVLAGETYAMLLNIAQSGGPQPIIDIEIRGTAILDCTPFVPLPSTLVSFKGYHQKDVNMLQWITASEINSDYFILERSSNGIQWESVTEVNAAGNSDQQLFYYANDRDYFPHVTYYRLQLVDMDGKMSYSEIISVRENDEEDEFILPIFPNPTSADVSFVFNGNDSETPLIVTVVNDNGAKVGEFEFEFVSKGTLNTFNTASYACGFYQVIFTQGNLRVVQKLSIIH